MPAAVVMAFAVTAGAVIVPGMAAEVTLASQSQAQGASLSAALNGGPGLLKDLARGAQPPGTAPETVDERKAMVQAVARRRQRLEQARVSRAQARERVARAKARERAAALQAAARAAAREQVTRAAARAKLLARRQAALAAAHTWVLPIHSYRFSSPFGRRWGRLHAGSDFAAPIGTPVVAMSTGTVVFAGQESGYGNKIEIKYWDGTVAWYAHLSQIDVSVGATVSSGQQIGASGNSGESTGPHLHLEIHPGGGQPVDPRAWLAGRGVQV